MADNTITYNISPVSKPRQTRRDKWVKRDCVMRYRAYADEVRLRKLFLPENGCQITFVLPMPRSWSKNTKEKMDGLPHQQKPDIDNLTKGLLDALYHDDSHIWNIHIKKLWGLQGQIIIAEEEKL